LIHVSLANSDLDRDLESFRSPSRTRSGILSALKAFVVDGGKVVCPHCYAEIEAGALRCKVCGKDARYASPSATGIGLNHILAEAAPSRVSHALEIVHRIEQLSPEFYAWLMADENARASKPPEVAEAVRDEVHHLFDVLMRLSRLEPAE